MRKLTKEEEKMILENNAKPAYKIKNDPFSVEIDGLRIGLAWPPLGFSEWIAHKIINVQPMPENNEIIYYKRDSWFKKLLKKIHLLKMN